MLPSPPRPRAHPFVRVCSLADFFAAGPRRRTGCLVAAVVIAAALSSSQSAVAQPSGEEVAEQTQPAVVAVISQQAVETRLGSGFFISPTLVVTNKQFLENDARLTIADASGRRIKAEEVVGLSADYDLALIRVADAERPHLTISNRSVVDGQAIFLVGAPLRGKSTFSTGKIISVGATGALMEITAEVTQRNSGSPILDDSGFVIGVATRERKMGDDVHFAVPADHLSDMLSIYEATQSADPLTLAPTTTPSTTPAGPTGASPSTATTTDAGTSAATPTTPVPGTASRDWRIVASIDRDLNDEARRAQIICGYQEALQTYGCDPNQLQGFSVRSEVQERAPVVDTTQNAAADLLYDQNGCASHLRVRIGSSTTPTVVDWSRASFIVNGRAVTAVQTLQAPGVRLEAPPGAVS